MASGVVAGVKRFTSARTKKVFKPGIETTMQKGPDQ
jgi:hypothetical protein